MDLLFIFFTYNIVIFNGYFVLDLTSYVTKDLLLTGAAGFGINNTIGKYFDEKTNQIKSILRRKKMNGKTNSKYIFPFRF